MSKKIMAQSRKYLGDSVIGYELGNEVRVYTAVVCAAA
jgi:hypothetical protein